MTFLPLRPRVKHYSGSNKNLRQKTADYNAIATSVTEHVNTLIANNSNEIQRYLFGSIARDLGLAVDLVRSAIGDGGQNGITIRVTENDRPAMARYKSKSA